MSFGVDTLGGLSEKLKLLVGDTQGLYESFIDATQLFKQGKMGEREYFAKIGEFLVASSAMNFLAVRVILELKGALDKGTSMKSPTGGSVQGSPQQSGFGLGGFVGAGGMAGPKADVVMPQPQSEPVFTPADVDLRGSGRGSAAQPAKNCIACGAAIPQRAKFCSKCGHSQ
ncbi:MAG: zinc ribbon domain-containing protein [Nitrososphaera sp.]|jgi:hypothetical protein